MPTSRRIASASEKPYAAGLMIAAASLMLLAALTGCVSSRGPFQSKKDPLFQKKLQRVLIAYLHQDTTLVLGNDFSSRFVSRLTEQLSRRNVQLKQVRLEKGERDRDARIQEAATQFKPTQLLYLGVTRASHIENRSSDRVERENSLAFEFSLVDFQSGKNVWRADVSYYGTPPRPSDVADALVKKLASDRLL
jgi:hypothetical protein